MFLFYSKTFLLILLNEYFWLNDAQICKEIISSPEEKTFLETYGEIVRIPNCNFLLRLQKKCFKTIIKSRIRSETVIVRQERSVCCMGYSKVNDICEPVCGTPCQNSICTSPDFCTCNPGYKQITSNRCDPVCLNCTNGQCVSPGNCVCDPGYIKNNSSNVCVPHCNLCDNGICVRPGECECNKGYKSYEKTPNEPICLAECEPPCKNAECLSPNKCICHVGYEFDITALICKPFCNNSCINGDCVSPNVCKCLKGFGFQDNSTSICKPLICANGSINDKGECVCFNGFRSVQTSDLEILCKPICDTNSSWNDSISDCVSIDIIGNRIDINDATSTTALYYNDNVDSDIYENECSNGVLEHGVCICEEGYRLANDSLTKFSCESDCDEECHNALCTGLNECTCLKGFHHNNTIFECYPICAPECVHGFCVSPNQCECNEGYQLSYNESSQHICEPICGDNDSEDCLNGTCISPSICKCFDGFELSNADSFHCVESQNILNSNTGTLNNMKTAIISGVIVIFLLLLGTVLLILKFQRKYHYVETKENPLIITYSK